MSDFEIPEDIAALNDDELAQALAGAVEAFDAQPQSTTVTTRDLESLRSLATCVDSIRTEQASRREAAEQAAEQERARSPLRWGWPRLRVRAGFRVWPPGVGAVSGCRRSRGQCPGLGIRLTHFCRFWVWAGCDLEEVGRTRRTRRSAPLLLASYHPHAVPESTR